MSFKQSIVEAKDLAKLQWKPFALTVLIVAGIYIGSITVQPGLVTYLLVLPPAMVVALTALARANDIGPERMTKRWHVRRIGLIMAGTGAVMLMGAPFTSAGYAITWRGVVFVWGVGLAWLTTPEMPPWEDYISGRYREPHADGRPRNHIRDFASRITGTYRVRDLQDGYHRRGEGDGP